MLLPKRKSDRDNVYSQSHGSKFIPGGADIETLINEKEKTFFNGCHDCLSTVQREDAEKAVYRVKEDVGTLKSRVVQLRQATPSQMT